MFISNIYEDVPESVKEKIHNEATRLGYELGKIVRYSNHPSDYYLFLVLAKGGYKGGYVTWLYNDSTNALCEGHYDMTFKEALSDLANRIVEVKIEN